MEAPVRPAAVELARLAGLPDERFRSAWPPPGGTLCFADENTIAVVVDEDAPAGTSTLGVAYGLGHAGDRDVHLLVPAGEESEIAERAAFLQHKLRVSGYDGSTITAMPPPARTEIREAGVSRAYVRDSETDPMVLRQGARFGLVCGVTTDGPGSPVLGVDDDGDLHVIVAAAAADDGALVLRALDSWLWATGDRGAGTALPGLRNDCRVLLTILLGGAVLSPYAPALLESLDRVEVRWRLAAINLFGAGRRRVRSWPGCPA